MAVVMSVMTISSALMAVRAEDADPQLSNQMPGLGSFIVFAFLATALYFLLKNMNARLRRMSYREREREAAEAAAAAEAAEDEAAAAGTETRADEAAAPETSEVETSDPDSPGSTSERP